MEDKPDINFLNEGNYNEFVLNVNGGNIFLEFIADKIVHSTAMSFGENNIFFSSKINKMLKPTQYLIFRYGTRLRDNTSVWNFDLRVDLEDNHLNIDIKKNEKCVNTYATDKSGKKLKSFFLHTLKGIPKELKINIHYSKWGESLDQKKLIKSYILYLS